MRWWNCRPYLPETTSKSWASVPSNSRSISRSPWVATAMGEARTSLTIAGPSEERIHRGGRRRDRRQGQERVPPDAGRLQAVSRDEQHDALVAIDPAVLPSASQCRDGRAARRFGEYALRLGQESLSLEDLRVARSVREAARLAHRLDRLGAGPGIADGQGLHDSLGPLHGTRPSVGRLEAADDRRTPRRLRPHQPRRVPGH